MSFAPDRVTDIDRTSGRQLVERSKSMAPTPMAICDVLCGCPDGLVADIQSVHLNSTVLPKWPRKRRGEAVLRWVEVRAVPDLHPGSS